MVLWPFLEQNLTTSRPSVPRAPVMAICMVDGVGGVSVACMICVCGLVAVVVVLRTAHVHVHV